LKIALTIAGSDSGAGAGIQADLKTFSALGVYASTVITAITAQNTKSVSKILEVPPWMIEQQIQSIMTDMPPDAIKIGMVYSKQIIDVVYHSLKRAKVQIVLDPIFAAGSGARLLRDDAFNAFVSTLVPISTLITPNRLEAEKLANMKIRTKSDSIKAAKKIIKLGAENVIVKGGHFRSSHVMDLFLNSKDKLIEIPNSRIKIKETHGSGCNFSSAVVAYIAKGTMLIDACKMANEYVHNAIKNSVIIGKGLPVINPLSEIYRDAARYSTSAWLQQAVEQLIKLPPFHKLIPETQTNFVYALPEAVRISEVAGVRGRIIKVDGTAVPASYIEFGASRHVASAVIAYMNINPTFRAAINIKFDDELIKICKSAFCTASYERSEEPKIIKKQEGSSVSWGIRSALAKNSKADVIYHTGDFRKEPMIIIFGKNPTEVIDKVKVIIKDF